MARENVIIQFIEDRLKSLGQDRLEAPLFASSNMQQGPDNKYADYFWTDGLLFLLLEIKPDQNGAIEEANKPLRQSLCLRLDADDVVAIKHIETGSDCHWMVYCIDQPIRPISGLSLAYQRYQPSVCLRVPGVTRNWSEHIAAFSSSGDKFESSIVAGEVGTDIDSFQAYLEFLGKIYSQTGVSNQHVPVRTFDGILWVWNPQRKSYESAYFDSFDNLYNFVLDCADRIRYQQSRPSGKSSYDSETDIGSRFEP